MEKTEKITYNCIRYRLDMTREDQEEIQEKLNEKAENGWEPFAISCFSSGATHFALVVYRKKVKD